MVRLAGASAGMTVVDPMCGGGTILAEQMALAASRRAGEVVVLGGDRDADAIRAAAGNLRRAGPVGGWSAGMLAGCRSPTRASIASPATPRLASSSANRGRSDRCIEMPSPSGTDVLRPGGRVVVLVGDPTLWHPPAIAVGWRLDRRVRGAHSRPGRRNQRLAEAGRTR